MTKIFKFIAVAAMAFGLASCGDKESKTYPAAADTKLTVAENAVGFYGDVVLGSPEAKVEIIEYASLTCPHCQYFDTTILPKLKEKYIDTGVAKIIFRNFTMNTTDLKAGLLMRCTDAAFAGKIKTALYARFETWIRAQSTDDSLAMEARRMGMPRTTFDRCMQNVDMQVALTQMKKTAIETYEVDATPTIIVQGKKTETYSFEDISAAIEAAK